MISIFVKVVIPKILLYGKNKLKFITEIASTHNGKISVVKKIFENHLKSDLII